MKIITPPEVEQAFKTLFLNYNLPEIKVEGHPNTFKMMKNDFTYELVYYAMFAKDNDEYFALVEEANNNRGNILYEEVKEVFMTIAYKVSKLLWEEIKEVIEYIAKDDSLEDEELPNLKSCLTIHSNTH